MEAQQFALGAATLLIFVALASVLIAFAILYALHLTKPGRQPAAQALDSLPVLRGADDA